MQLTREKALHVWLVSDGVSGDDLEEALRISTLGHNLTRLDSNLEFEEAAKTVDIDSPRCPSLLLFLMSRGPEQGEHFLRQVKASQDFRHIPVVLFYTDHATPDLKTLYRLGAASAIRMPLKFTGLTQLMRVMEAYWFDAASMPSTNSRRSRSARSLSPND